VDEKVDVIKVESQIPVIRGWEERMVIGYRCAVGLDEFQWGNYC
jgi:hypothetical protein